MQLNKTLTRYLLVGMVNTVFGYSMFALLAYLGVHYTVAVFFSTVIGVFFSFKTFGRFVFMQSDWRLIWRFISVYGFLYSVNVGCIFVLMMYIDNVYAANALTLVFIAGLGFVLNRSFVYANS